MKLGKLYNCVSLYIYIYICILKLTNDHEGLKYRTQTLQTAIHIEFCLCVCVIIQRQYAIEIVLILLNRGCVYIYIVHAKTFPTSSWFSPLNFYHHPWVLKTHCCTLSVCVSGDPLWVSITRNKLISQHLYILHFNSEIESFLYAIIFFMFFEFFILLFTLIFAK